MKSSRGCVNWLTIKTVELDDLAHLHFALGKALEDQEEYQDSFSHYEKGNSIRKKQTRYEASAMSARLKLQRWVCNEAFFCGSRRSRL